MNTETTTGGNLHYSELHCYSNFSFLVGASHPEELVQQASTLGYKGLAITDECSVAGVVRAHVEARNHSLKLIIGSDFKTEDGLHLILLAPTRQAYGQLCTLITLARRRSDKGHYRLDVKDLNPLTKDCLCLWLPSVQQCQQLDAAAKQLIACYPQQLWIC